MKVNKTINTSTHRYLYRQKEIVSRPQVKRLGFISST